MRLLTAAQMRAVDNQVVTETGIPSIVLMENAGRQVAEVAATFLEKSQGRKIAILTGKGNNAGDGFVAARYLSNLGYKVRLFLCARAEELVHDALANYRICEQLGIDMQEVDEQYLPKLRFGLSLTDLVVDALLGTGIRGEPQGIMAQVIQLVNEVEKPVLAVDVPSGLDASIGTAYRPCIKANMTVTFAAPKVGLFIHPGVRQTGLVYVANIGIPPKILNLGGPGSLLTASATKELIPCRVVHGHKGTFGHVLLLAGSVGMTGAASLATYGALRSGAGLVSLGVPASLNDILEMKVTEAMTIPLPETAERSLSVAALPIIQRLLPHMDAVVIGPGLGQHDSTGELVEALLLEATCPVLLDADGLNLAAKTRCLDKRQIDKDCPLVITPHPGEMARLLECSIADIEKDRIRAALTAAQRFSCIAVLKGAGTVVGAWDGRFWVNTTGNPGMATGGTGDVLSGMVGGFMAGGIDPVAAARAAVYIHGLAGDMALKKQGEVSLLAGDLVEAIPEALNAIQKEEVKERWSYLV